MYLKEFIEKFLPDYEQKRKNYTKEHNIFSDTFFACEFFPQALQNFSDKLCSKQRENCFKSAEIIDKDVMMSAEQPKIEELL